MTGSGTAFWVQTLNVLLPRPFEIDPSDPEASKSSIDSSQLIQGAIPELMHRACAVATIVAVQTVRQVIVFDAADLQAESAFWAGILGGRVFEDDAWHSVVDAAGEWRIGVQLAPNHIPPDWPDGTPQQVHLDLHVNDPRAAHEEAVGLGARLLRPAADLDAAEGHQVYADPAGHPFCIGWGHPSQEALAAFVTGHGR
jgi:catechol 2,3-dioxygenase-like lactoylglutathione lyase family enzyme